MSRRFAITARVVDDIIDFSGLLTALDTTLELMLFALAMWFLHFFSLSTPTPPWPVFALECCSSRWQFCKVKKVKASCYIAQYPVLRTVQGALRFTSVTDLFTQTPSQLFWEASSHMLQLMREGCSYTYPPLSIVRYSFIQLTALVQCRVKKTCPRF